MRLTRSLQGMFVISAFFLLTGAKGQGCGGQEEDPGDTGAGGGVSTSSASGGEGAAPPDGGLVCCPGTHLETICEPPTCDGSPPICREECVPDPVCPPDHVPFEVCDDSGCHIECAPR